MGLDLLTWAGIRALATCEALTPSRTDLVLATPDPRRPIIKWADQRHWFDCAELMVPRAGDILYTRTGWRDVWRTALVQRVTDPVVLVSTFYDPTIKPQACAEMFPPHSPIAHWFGVQAMATHPRLTAMPVGVEPSVVPILEATERRATRDVLCYVNFQLQHRGMPIHPERSDVWRVFSARSWVTAEKWRADGTAHYLAQLGRAKFVVSPPGLGWDCYRTYEALAMGAIPIVRRVRPISDVCDDLPVLMVDSWNEITPEVLQHVWAERAGQVRDLQTLTLTYWRKRILAAAAACKESHGTDAQRATDRVRQHCGGRGDGRRTAQRRHRLAV